MVADYDMVNHQLANGRLADGTPIPIGEIANIAVDAQVLPTVFEVATGDLRMGRSHRTATDMQRAALALRDKGCVGCGIAPERCQRHHIDHWQHDGCTDYDNLVTVCADCHNDKIHQQGFTVEWDTHDARFGLQPPNQPTDGPTGRTPSNGASRTRTPRQPTDRPAGQAPGDRECSPTHPKQSTDGPAGQTGGHSGPRAPPR